MQIWNSCRQYRVLGAACRLLAIASLVAVATLGGSGCSDDGKLKIHRIAPDHGTHLGGDSVTIYGANFQKGGAMGAKVYFANTPARVKGFDGGSKLLVNAPPGKVGDVVDITIIFEGSGAMTLPKAYRYVDPAPLMVNDLVEDKK